MPSPWPSRLATLAACVLLSGNAWGGSAVRLAGPGAMAPPVAPVPARALPAPEPAAAGSEDAAGADAGAREPIGIYLPSPRYPEDMRTAGVGGKVVLVVTIAPDGSVNDVEVEDSRPAGVFDALALEAARGWRFLPRLEHGEPVESRIRVPLEFDPGARDEG